MRNKYSSVHDCNSFSTNAGDTHRINFTSRFDSDGVIRLVESGRTDIQAEINSYAEQTDMAVIINRLQNGDTSVLSSKPAFYGDFTNFPSTFAEAFDLVHRSEDAFYSLPLDIRKKFDNDRAKWFSSIGTSFWFDAMGITPVSDAIIASPSISESEVVE